MPNWTQVLKEINAAKVPLGANYSPADVIRRKYVADLHKHTGRNIICYYSGFLSKPKALGIEINDEDKNGFMLCVHKVDRAKGLDLLLHTPGGNGAATESLVNYLKQMFGDDVRAIVPQIAMSAGTMIACSCRELIMGKHSNIGPVDPQFNGIPAHGVISEIKMAFEEIKKDQRASLVWNPILQKLPPSFVQQCHWAIQKSEDFIGKALMDGLLKKLPEEERKDRHDRAVKQLTDLSSNKGHDKHFHYQDCIDMGLPVTMLEDPKDKVFQDLVLTVHHCFMHTLANTAAIKIIENHLGRAMVKQVPAAPGNMIFQLPPGVGMPGAPSAEGEPH